MNTLLLATQIVCYGVGILSASLNVARFVRRWRAVEAPFKSDEPGDWP